MSRTTSPTREEDRPGPRPATTTTAVRSTRTTGTQRRERSRTICRQTAGASMAGHATPRPWTRDTTEGSLRLPPSSSGAPSALRTQNARPRLVAHTGPAQKRSRNRPRTLRVCAVVGTGALVAVFGAALAIRLAFLAAGAGWQIRTGAA